MPKYEIEHNYALTWKNQHDEINIFANQAQK